MVACFISEIEQARCFGEKDMDIAEQRYVSERQVGLQAYVAVIQNAADMLRKEKMLQQDKMSSEFSHASHACFSTRFPRHNDRILPWELLFLL